MNHQPFENWLLSHEQLDPQQETELDQHVKSCAGCANLAQAWQNVEAELKRAPQAAPAPGFSHRWQAVLAQKRSKRQRRMIGWIIALNLAAALAIFTALNWEQLANLSFPGLLVSALYTLTLVFARIDSAQLLIRLLLETANPVILIMAATIVGTGICALSLTWMFSIYKIFLPQGVRNEARY
jgi:anti-sigma factor RsiW